MRTCPAKGCGKSIPRTIAFCAPHWKRIPKAIQTAIYSAFKRKQWRVWEDQMSLALKELNHG